MVRVSQLAWLLVVCLFSTSCMVAAFDEGVNFVLNPNMRRCFYEEFEDSTIPKEIEVFVAAGGSLDIMLSIYGPLTKPDIHRQNFEEPLTSTLVNPAKMDLGDTSSYIEEFAPQKNGLYAVCLDNRKATFISKFVQIDIRERPREVPIAIHMGGEQTKSAEESDERAVTRVMETMERVKRGIRKVENQLKIDMHRLLLHSADNKLAAKRVMMSSLVETMFFIAAALFQIFYVRRWFANRRPTQKFASKV